MKKKWLKLRINPTHSEIWTESTGLDKRVQVGIFYEQEDACCEAVGLHNLFAEIDDPAALMAEVREVVALMLGLWVEKYPNSGVVDAANDLLAKLQGVK